MGPINLSRVLKKGLENPVNSNLFFRSLLITLIYLHERHNTLWRDSSLISETLKNLHVIFIGLLDQVKDKPIDSNNKSTVITCLMIVFTLKFLGWDQVLSVLIESLLENKRLYANVFLQVLRTGMVYFAQKPCDSADLNPILYVKYNPQLMKVAEELVQILSR